MSRATKHDTHSLPNQAQVGQPAFAATILSSEHEPAPHAPLNELLLEVRELRTNLRDAQSRLAQVDDLRHIASTLMRKYDTENSLLRQRIELLSRQNQSLADAANPIDVAKLNAKLQQIADALARIQS